MVDNSSGRHSGIEAPDFKSQKLEGTDNSTVDPDGAVIDTNDLFKGAQEVRIKHNDTFYRLRSTRFGKLLLTK
jgi:hemin uptake protein HemP